MNEDKLQEFAQQVNADPEQVVDRWQGRPDLMIDDLFRVRDLDTGEVRDLELFDVQREFVHAYFYSDAGTINAYKGRRIGYSFVATLCFVLESLLYPHSFYPVVAGSLSQAKERIDDIQNIIDHAKVEIPTEKENTDYIELKNGSAFMAYSSDSDTSRGADSARAVLLDEMAFMEDEERAYRAFGAFLALGTNRKMVEISTPNTKNDLFMQEHEDGSPDGENGIVSIKQPTFRNADEIDIHQSLLEQRLEPSRPDLNISYLETQRKSDPEGFGQEYLCRPVVDEYRFFDADSIQAAQARELDEQGKGRACGKPVGARRVMGIDVGMNRDDTVLSIMDHHKGQRIQRDVIVVTREVLQQAGVRQPDPENVNDVAELINVVHKQMDVDLVIVDQGGVGKTFPSVLQRKIGREVVNFDFSDKKAVADMMGDTNIALRDGKVDLMDDDRLRDEMQAVVKEKRDHYAKPKFTGKDYSESGKDDTAMATVLSAFPPNHSADPVTDVSVRERQSQPREASGNVASKDDDQEFQTGAHGATTVSRNTRKRTNQYGARNSRPRRR
jgi:phage terminase large subunit-like protein